MMRKFLKTASSIAGILATIGSLTIFFPVINASGNVWNPWNIIWCIFLVIVCLALITNAIWDFIEKRRYHHTFNSESEEFRDFFSKWYAKPGMLSIICDDIEWTNRIPDDPVYAQLINKSKSHELLLLLDSGLLSPLAQNLKKNGATLRRGPSNIISQFSFSCISVMGNRAGQAIVRNKRKDRGNIIAFDEIRDQYVIEFLNTLIKK